ncbi:hypothetical protein FRC10_005289 [Ceratobasidium sp. 414]|nr:hypothetical protein FRC10_005289 [Ceratobasidium sp. 414]
MAEDSLAILARSAQLLAEMRAQDLRVDEAMKELSAVIASAPRWDEESDAPVASSSTERRKTGMMARTDVSPLAHENLERSSGLSAAGLLPTPGASRMPGDDPENAGWMPFNPTATSSPGIRRSMRPDRQYLRDR